MKLKSKKERREQIFAPQWSKKGRVSRFDAPQGLTLLEFVQQGLNLTPKKAFSIAEAMIVFTIVSVAIASVAPMISKQAKYNEMADTQARVLDERIKQNAVPKGAIMMWSGSLTNIPSGWALCNGSNGTPDLRNKFIVGAGDDYIVGNNGGKEEITLEEKYLPPHSHTKGSMRIVGSITSVDTNEHLTYSDLIKTTGAFKVSSEVITSYSGNDAGKGGAIDNFYFDTNYSNDAWTGNTSVYGGEVVSTDSKTGIETRAAQKLDIRPPYYALAYIMKIK